MPLSASSLRYLLAIYELSDGGAAVRSVDIAKTLCVTRASVVKSLKKLASEGFIHKEYYGNVQLTPLGVREANRVFTEYTLLFAYFTQSLGVCPECGREDALSALSFLTKETKESLIRKALDHSISFETAKPRKRPVIYDQL